jgi:hypothetical protein
MISDKRPTISPFERFVLTFMPSYFATDYNSGITVHYKKLFGKMYILSEITDSPDPLDEDPEKVYTQDKPSQEGT